MIKNKLYFFVLVILFVFGNQGSVPVKNKIPKEKIAKAITIIIQPYSDISEKYITHVKNELTKIYPNIILNKAIPLPKRAYYIKRNRYRADTLINILRQTTQTGCVTIGMTTKDISDSKGNIPDYGIMGLGYQPGSSCVVSTFRLNKENLLEQFFKLSIHELGHTQGLPHCPVKTCFMRDAEGKNHTNEEKEFCPKCKAHLISKGWIFKD
ncbi:MAG: Zn-dependent protease [Bacteroidia bacterium]|nr:Zn-dependent protease [Bacteroidia bacterium]